MNVSVPSVREDTTIMISVATSLLPYEGIAILTPLEAKNSVTFLIGPRTFTEK